MAGAVMAQTISPNVAAKKAAGIFSEANAARSLSGVSANVEPQLAYVSVLDGDTCFYVFNNPQGGFAIIGGDLAARELLATVDKGTFDINAIPSAEDYLLRQYAQDIRCAKKAGVISKVTQAGAKDIAAICQTIWDQDTPYNNLCPKYDGKNTALTGCVATAAAQCLYAMVSNASDDSGIPQKLRKDLTADVSCKHELVNANEKVIGYATQTFSRSTTIDWDNMYTFYDGSETTAEKTAIATLMKLMGICCGMQYGPESGAFPSTLCRGLVNYLGIQTKFIERSDSKFKTDYAWENFIYKELAAGRPVCYEGSNNGQGGHEFVVDGYRVNGNLFHVNWGWSGSTDGYYALSSASDKKAGGYGEGSWMYPTPSEQESGSSKGYYRDENSIVYNFVYNANSLPFFVPAEDADDATYSQSISSEARALEGTTANSTTFYAGSDLKVSFGTDGVKNNGNDTELVWAVELDPLDIDGQEEYYSWILTATQDDGEAMTVKAGETVSGYTIPLGDYMWEGDEEAEDEDDCIPFGYYTITPCLVYDGDDDGDFIEDSDITYVALPYSWKAPTAHFIAGSTPDGIDSIKAESAYGNSTGSSGKFLSKEHGFVAVKHGKMFRISGQRVK